MGSSLSSRARPAAVRLGSTLPRIFTPPLVEGPAGPCGCGCALDEDSSLGFSVVSFAADVLRVDLKPWQRWLMIHALELRPDGSFRFRTVVLLVARQNGKSTISQVLSLWVMYVLGWRLVLGTAQDLDTAEEVWSGAVELVQETDPDTDEPVRPELAELVKRVVQVNGKKSLDLVTGTRYKVKAAGRRGGRGLSGDLILLDELREHQSWDAWGAITKTTMARDEAQIWALSNAGDAASIVLRYLRKMAHAELGDPDGVNAADDPEALLSPLDGVDVEDIEVDPSDDSLGIFEWSASPGCDVHDRDGWAQANPSLGYLISERTIASAARTDPEWIFRTEVLCQWTDGSLEGPFPAGSWDECLDPESQVADRDAAVFCLDVSWDRSHSYIAVAGLRDDGLPHVGVVARRAGTDWVIGWLTDPAHPDRSRRKLVVQTKGAPASSLVDELKVAGLDVVEWGGPDLGRACGIFYDLVRDGKLRRRAQPVLDVPAATAVTKPLGEAWVWDRRKSPTDASPLMAATGAVWAVAPKPTEPAPTIFAPPDEDTINRWLEETPAWP